jgi:hypothetical protein
MPSKYAWFAAGVLIKYLIGGVESGLLRRFAELPRVHTRRDARRAQSNVRQRLCDMPRSLSKRLRGAVERMRQKVSLEDCLGLTASLRNSGEAIEVWEWPMCSIEMFRSRMGFSGAIIAFSMATVGLCHGATAKDRVKLQKQQYAPVQSACIPSFGSRTVLGRSGKAVQVQSSTCIGANGKTTVIARPFGSENDKYVCVGECRVVRMCLLQYCYNETVCDPCARVVVVIGPD